MVSIKILVITVLLSVVAATHHLHSHHKGRPLKCFGRLHGGIRGKAGLAPKIFLNLADRDYPANFDDAVDVILTGTRGGGLIIDVAIPNLGRLYRRMIMAASRLVLCVHNLLELPLRILRRVLTGRDDEYSPVCNYGYGKKWGWLRHQCDYSSTRSIIKEYELKNARGQIDTCIREYNGGDIERLSGSHRVIVEAMYNLADLFADSNRKWSKKDYTGCIAHFFTITGAISNSYDGKLGSTVIDALYDSLGKTVEDKGFSISTHISTIKGKMNRCKKQEFNGVFDTNSANTNNNEGSRTNEDDSIKSDSSDSENDASNSSDKHSTNSEKNKKSKSGVDKSKNTEGSKYDKRSEESKNSDETSDESDSIEDYEQSEELKDTDQDTSDDRQSNESDDSKKESGDSVQAKTNSKNSKAHKSSNSKKHESSKGESQKEKNSRDHSASSNPSKDSNSSNSIHSSGEKNENPKVRSKDAKKGRDQRCQCDEENY